jgi:hypothetical protein
MKKKLMALMLLAGGSMFAATRFSVGVSVGSPSYYTPGYYTAPAYAPAYAPPCPGPGYTWSNGAWRAPVVNNFRGERRDFDRNNVRRDDHARDRGRDSHYRGDRW